ncbi:cation:proton antiporter family protein [Pseudemcibacter aquimaris]|uniref:cation:proton antiporter family protein n=1 Tax=Pseudemcibacter aquimaris TaxID=2857064 RepID=UPI002012C371|nr:cation:proton antiporter family protein [Pseudemcibacter aquimaris]MCC3860595.1 cation:proton antiporter [Pseudemcibacter aquimaris]WDU59416.1 cation:proton antiporter [Pseudemcibacter aquimaris]
MDYIWVLVAFVFGFAARQINLPPLVGYLIAGFGLHALGVEPEESLETLSDLGVTLLLFTIGLKLDIKSLLKTEIWGSATAHMGIVVFLTTINSLFFAYLGLSFFDDLNVYGALLIGLAVSFSSTVCAVKVLEERSELRARHGQVTIGILIIQDIAAVLFVTFASAKIPSIWALGLVGLPLLRPYIIKLLEKCGHGELLPLAGFFLAYSGGELFALVGLKEQLGALVIAVLISGHVKSNELAKSLMNFKDIFLIGFFLSIGFTALPTLDMIFAALIMCVFLPIKAGLFFVIMTQLKLRGRTAFLSSLSLANYSEFGLIVVSASVGFGMLAKEWLVILALVVTFSFIFSSILNSAAHRLYAIWRSKIVTFEKHECLPEDVINVPKNASILIIGMGRVGTGAYDTLIEKLHGNVCGIEVIRKRAADHIDSGRNVVNADAEDPAFWEHVDLSCVEMIMFAIPNHLDILEIVKQLRHVNYSGKMAGIAKYEDNKQKLLDCGIDVVFNFYQKAGAGFADKAIKTLQQ